MAMQSNQANIASLRNTVRGVGQTMHREQLACTHNADLDRPLSTFGHVGVSDMALLTFLAAETTQALSAAQESADTSGEATARQLSAPRSLVFSIDALQDHGEGRLILLAAYHDALCQGRTHAPALQVSSRKHSASSAPCS